MDTARPDYSIYNLTSNPEFDFINNVRNNDPNVNNDPNPQNFFNYIPDSPYESSNFHCSYIDPIVFSQTYNNNKKFSIMSLNIQSISAKMNVLTALLSLFNSNLCSPDIICLQELWQFPENAVISLPGYGPLIYKLRCGGVQGGGVGFLIKSSIQFSILPNVSIFVDRIFESMFIEILLPNKSKAIIGNIYRPGSTHPSLSPLEQYDNFSEIFSNILNSLGDSGVDFHLLGDFNIDLLKIKTNARSTFFIWPTADCN